MMRKEGERMNTALLIIIVIAWIVCVIGGKDE